MNVPLTFDEKYPLQNPQRGASADALSNTLLNAATEITCERVARMATRFLRVPSVLICLRDGNRQLFELCYGLSLDQAILTDDSCAPLILPAEVMVVPDATLDARFAANPLVTGAPGIRFWAGAPLISPEGQNIGVFAVFDVHPRDFDEAEKETLVDLAAQVVDTIQLRQIALQLREQNAQREQAEAEVRRQVATLRSILDSAGEGIVVADTEGRLLVFNPMAERITGVGPTSAPPSEWPAVYGLFLPDGITPAAPDQMPIARAIRGEVTGETEWFIRNPHLPDGIAVSASARPLLDETGAGGGVVVFRDISERKQAEKALEAAKSEAERANRAKSEFLSRMSHELRTPMNSILGFAQLLESQELDPGDYESVEQILRAGRHLLQLINEVLEITRVESNDLTLACEPVNLASMLQVVLDMARPLSAQRNIQLIHQTQSCNFYAQADPQRLTQILLNLTSNAIKYNREGGQVFFSCHEVSRASSEASSEASKWARIEVRDTGAGLSAEDISRLFVPFERLGAAQSGIEGNGIGLVLSKSLVEAMGGQIGVYSTVGEGSVFWVEIPQVEIPHMESSDSEKSESGVGQRMALNSPHATYASSKVLYIEDNLANLELVAAILKKRPNIQLLSAMQGSLGLELAREHQPDLILLDVHLPDMTGDKLLQQLQEEPKTQAAPVVVLSADATSGQIECLLAAGATDYLTKPVNVKNFLDVIDALLENAQAKKDP